jgi:hypothetical protein
MVSIILDQVKSWMQTWLGISDLKDRLRRLEKEMAVIERMVETFLDELKGYRNKSESELNLLKRQVTGILDQIDGFFEENEKSDELAGSEALATIKGLRRRLRYNRTLIDKHLEN